MFKKYRIATEKTTKIVRKIREVSLSEGAGEARVKIASFGDWIRIYETEAIEGFLRKGTAQDNIEMKIPPVTEYLTGTGNLRKTCIKNKI